MLAAGFCPEGKIFLSAQSAVAAAMAETPASLKSTTRPQASLYICIITYLSIDLRSMFACRLLCVCVYILYTRTCTHFHVCDERVSQYHRQTVCACTFICACCFTTQIDSLRYTCGCMRMCTCGLHCFASASDAGLHARMQTCPSTAYLSMYVGTRAHICVCACMFVYTASKQASKQESNKQ